MVTNIILDPQLKWQHFNVIDSTNAYLLSQKQPIQQLVSADQQTQGRGQHQRQWIDQGDSLLFSLSTLINTGINLNAWPVQVAITLAQTLQQQTQQPIKIKWPNDLYTRTKTTAWGKFGGILVESKISKYGGQVVTGIGINLSPIHADINADYPAAYLDILTGKTTLLFSLANALFSAWQHFIDNPTVDPNIFQVFDLLSQKQLIATHHQTQQPLLGIGAGINADGHFYLQQATTRTALTSQHTLRIVK